MVRKDNQIIQSCYQSVQRAIMDRYGPDMTPAMRAALEKEIAAFNEKETLAEIERNVVSGPSVPGYTEWLQEHGMIRGDVPLEAEPDLLSEDEAVNLTKPDLPDYIVKAKQEIDDLLSHRELQVWRLVMRQGMPHEKAASLLHVGVGSIHTYLQRAKAKIDEHFNQGGTHER